MKRNTASRFIFLFVNYSCQSAMNNEIKQQTSEKKIKKSNTFKIH